MPEAVLCKDCKQSINKEVDQYVVIEKGNERYPETIAHVICEQKRASSGMGRGRSGKMAFIDLGDQFINLSEGRVQGSDEARHFGLVVDDKEKVRRRLKEAGVKTLPGRGVEF